MKSIKIAILAFGAAVMLSACGSKTPASPANEGDAIKAKVEVTTNPDSIKAYAEEAMAYADKLAKEGKYDEASAFMQQFVEKVQAKNPEVAAFVSGACGAANQMVSLAADSVMSSIDECTGDCASCGKCQGNEAVENAKAALHAAGDAAKAADDAAKAANEAAKALNNLKK